MSPPVAGAVAQPVSRRRDLRRSRGLRFLRTPEGAIGVVLLAAIVAVALLGPLLAPHPLDAPISAPGMPPSADAPLGTDALGRDVFSRLLDGGRSVLTMAAASTLLIYLVGGAVGMAAGYARGWVDSALMRAVDVLLSFPALLVLLVLVAGAGSSSLVLVAGIVIALAPGVARLVRSATLEVSTRGYVEAAVVRGESAFFVLRREILPNVAHVILADLGLRFVYTIVLAASVNFLGLGFEPPAANWGLMVSENRMILSTNVWSVLAPAGMLALLTIAVCMVGDAYARAMGRSGAGA